MLSIIAETVKKAVILIIRPHKNKPIRWSFFISSRD